MDIKKTLLLVFVIGLFFLSSCAGRDASTEESLSPSGTKASIETPETSEESNAPESAESGEEPSVSDGSGETDTLAQDTPENESINSSYTETDTELKELVLMYCTDVYDAVYSAEFTYSNYVDSFGFNVSAGKDAYELSEKAYGEISESLEFLQDLNREDVKEEEGFADFNYYSAAYVSGMLEIPKRVMNSLNGEDDISERDSKTDSEVIAGYKNAYKSSLVAFLESVGYEWDEVSAYFYNWERE